MSRSSQFGAPLLFAAPLKFDLREREILAYGGLSTSLARLGIGDWRFRNKESAAVDVQHRIDPALHFGTFFQGQRARAVPSGSPALIFSILALISAAPVGNHYFNVVTGAASKTEIATATAMIPVACTADSLNVTVGTAPGGASETFTVRWGTNPSLSSTPPSCRAIAWTSCDSQSIPHTVRR